MERFIGAGKTIVSVEKLFCRFYCLSGKNYNVYAFYDHQVSDNEIFKSNLNSPPQNLST